MKKIILFFVILLFSSSVYSKDFFCDRNYHKTNVSKAVLNDLGYAEIQIFKKLYAKDDIEERLERLEIALYGAIQEGEEKSRIKKIKKDTTNISSGGTGLQYAVSPKEGLTNLMSNFSYGLGNTYGNRTYMNNYNRYNDFHHHYAPHSCCSHRLPPPPPKSTIMYPQNHYYNQNSRYLNGNLGQNFSLGTSIKILDD